MFPRTLLQHAHDTLALLGRQSFLKPAYLAGGSALALQLGHRRSEDFDFFSGQEFLTSEIKAELNKIGSYIKDNETPKTMVGKFNDVKFSYFYYPYKLIDDTVEYFGIKLASPKEIAAMKLVAITDRGTKKDYIDLYFLAHRKFRLEKMLEFYDQKYQILESNRLTLLKALQFFEDADRSEMPEMIEKVDWEEVKKFFQKEVVRLANKFI